MLLRGTQCVYQVLFLFCQYIFSSILKITYFYNLVTGNTCIYIQKYFFSNSYVDYKMLLNCFECPTDTIVHIVLRTTVHYYVYDEFGDEKS